MKTIYTLFYLLFCTALLMGCSAEADLESTSGRTDSATGEAQVILNFSVPLNNLPSATRSVSITDDAALDEENLRIWVFKKSKSASAVLFEEEITKNSKCADGVTPRFVIRDTGGLQKQVYVLLGETEDETTLCLIANVNGVTAPSIGTEHSEALKGLKYSIAADAPEMTRMPMFGQAVLTGVKQGTKVEALSLRRALAKVEIDARDAFALLKLEGMEIYNANTDGYVAPLGAIRTPSASALTVYKTVNQAEDNLLTLYIPELEGVNDGAQKDKLFILLQGRYISDNHTSYYRLEFIPREADLKNKIVRNTKYAFYIENVNASGYTSKEEAINGSANNNQSVKLVEQVITDETIMDITTDGADYLGVTKSQVTTRVTDNEEDNYYFANFSVVCSNSNGWKMETSEFGDGVTVSVDKGLSNVVSSIWIFVEKGKAQVGNTISVYVSSGSIRKKIEVLINE